jgi:hypothetical protein
MGLVIFAGISIGTLFTLFVVPTFYCPDRPRISRACGCARACARPQPAPGE